MDEILIDELARRIEGVGELYHRLLLLVGPTGSGKTRVLRGLGQRMGTPVMNLNLEVSVRLLDLSTRKRVLQLPSVLQDIFGPTRRIHLVDNIELLFHPSLQQDPLRVLQQVARRHTLVASWGGTVTGERLVYGNPDHPEHRRYPIREVQFVTTQTAP